MLLLRLIIMLRADALGGVSFSNLTVHYGDKTARFASSMPWLSVAAGQPVTQSGKPVADPKAAAEIQQVRAPSASLSRPLVPTTSAKVMAAGAAALRRRDRARGRRLHRRMLGGLCCFRAEG